jgi:hypothetical protein
MDLVWYKIVAMALTLSNQMKATSAEHWLALIGVAGTCERMLTTSDNAC